MGHERLPELSASKTCSACGSTELLLCEDMTRYTPLSVSDGVLFPGQSRMEADETLESVRLMCPECGEYHAVPEEFL